MGEYKKRRRATGRCARHPGAQTRLVRILLALLLALAPAINLAAPVAPRADVAAPGGVEGMAQAGSSDARFDVCAHESAVAADDSGCGEPGHAGAAHHVDSHCLQCIAFGTPGLAGAPDIVAVDPAPVAETIYRCGASSSPTSRHLAAQGCRGPPVSV